MPDVSPPTNGVVADAVGLAAWRWRTPESGTGAHRYGRNALHHFC
jgi:hypothetical protein